MLPEVLFSNFTEIFYLVLQNYNKFLVLRSELMEQVSLGKIKEKIFGFWGYREIGIKWILA